MPYADSAARKAYDKRRSERYKAERGEDYGRWSKCRNGHSLSKANTYVRPSDGKRTCRICKAAAQRRYRLRAMEPERRIAWLAKNRNRIRRYNGARRARKRHAFIETVDAAVVYERDGGICGLCGESVDPSDFHVDHVLPLARGGLHEYANVQLSHPACNLLKGAKLELASG